jgi:peptidoglycan/xylan/chitin deacetylase (PgdA/CDA1 family)
VALTFHTDGSEDLAGRLVEELARTATPVTCFMVGRWLDAHPSWATRLHQAGHELANHTYTHPTSGRLTGSALQADITRCRDALVRLTGSPGRFFRVSGTDDGVTLPTPTILAASVAAGYTELAGYDVDPADYQDPGSAQVVSRTLAAVKPGSIVSLHFGHAGTVEAVPQILAGLHQRGLQPVTLTDLLGP